MLEIFSLPMVILYSILFGVTMKIADLLDEHGLRWFKGDAYVFGFLWGFFGVLLILFRTDVANVLFARILAYLPRKSLDYLNHIIAGLMIMIAFIWKAEFSPLLFFSFFAIFVIFGFTRDYFGNKKPKSKKGKKSALFFIHEPALHYLVFTFIYGLISGSYYVFLVFTLSQLSYNAIKYGFYYAGWSKEI